MSQATRILIALAGGLILGIALSWWAPAADVALLAVTEPVGTIWLHGLQMTIVPLVVGLLVCGIAATAEAARASRLATRALAVFIALLWTSSALAAAIMFGLLDLFPLSPDAAAALKGAVASAGEVGKVPPFAEFLVAMVPTNPLSAAANDQFLPLIVFTVAFGFAVTRLPEEPRKLITAVFQAIADTMLIVIGWVLWLAPVGVFALAFTVGAKAGGAAFGALLHYVFVITATGAGVTLLVFPVALIGGRLSIGAYLRAMTQPAAVAVSTQSSLASLPAMLRATEKLGVPVATSGVVLPLAVAIFRFTGPAMNLAVALYVAHIFGVQLTAGQIAIGIAAAAVTTMGAVSLPGTISFVSSIAPIALAMGLPIGPLALLVAVETFPDIMRTLGNVAMDVAATSAIARRSGTGDAMTEADAILAEAPQ
ncbi:dicarboxylate/amino acid:cation symporter [Sphingomonas donggukensis]|uniref:Dicarboxylate/amino acid:cation symporter n=1 Tax=Sphingomonas donggukensis TaxID=2949093 RepID=A0ABY4TXZ5_9SPHN|nr:cation:dicarboxylase symporter family transporter [Sphingomonas donggukensis]URW75411.1 dicarboxylate/amino acid:cation symporter [Sphingomonas donggukensis]